MRTLALLLIAVTAVPTAAQEVKPFGGRRSDWNGFAKYDFPAAGTSATVVVPARPLAGRPWLWRGEFFGAFAEADAAMVKEGWHLVYLRVPDLFGSPKAVAAWEKFYEVLTKDHGLHPKPGFIGLSRGGLYVLNWAAAHPDRTLGVYLDNAVCDFKSWPGGKPLGKGTAPGSASEWKKLLAAYDFKTDADALAYKLNPVDNLAPLAKAKIPLLLVYGDADKVVPHAENSGIVFDRYKALGGPAERVVKPGGDHHPHGLKDVSPVVSFFKSARSADAKAGVPKDVKHAPATPKPGDTVRVTARLAAGTTKPVLRVQVVEPGKYVRKSDPAYEKAWTDLPMAEKGGLWSAEIPAASQKHRHLVRYRVFATDAAGREVRSPAPDDECPNHAYFCDGGPAAWSGAAQPGKTKAATFPADFLGTMQSLTLLARESDVARSQWDGNAHKQRQEGTIVYRGVVYDHVFYSNRGQGSAHIAGKNKWGLKFAKGHDLPFVDHEGVESPAAIDGLNLNPGCYTAYMPVLRGVAGLDEVMSMRAYRLAGVPSPSATWVQWRVVTTKDEMSAKDQYAGDLWGLYVAVGEMKPKVLADPSLESGLTVSMQSGLKHTPKGMADGQGVWNAFLNKLRSGPDEKWCRDNLDLKAYYSFHAMNRLLGNTDLRPDGNHGYYRSPEGKWAPIPWDNDMMFVPRNHQPGHIDAMTCLRHTKIAIEYRNRAREILDLFAADATDKGGQVGQLTADLAAALTPKGFDVDWPRLDQARWDHHPRMNPEGVFNLPSYDAGFGGGNWRRTIATPDFTGFKRLLVEFCTDSRPVKSYRVNDGDQRGYGWGHLAIEAKDDKIPARATVSRMKETMKFEATGFASAAGHKAAALEWRVGRVGKRGWYELDEHWAKETPGREVEIPKEVFKDAGEYRVRARWRDESGRCGHWSAAVGVVVK